MASTPPDGEGGSRHERGEAGVGIGTLAMACLVLGELDRLTQLLDPATDATGLLMETDALPRRIVSRRAVPESRAPTSTAGPAPPSRASSRMPPRTRGAGR